MPAPLNFEFNPNIAPTEPSPILRTSKSEGRTWDMARFGLVPDWKTGGASLHNARSETIKEKPAFKKAYEQRRCIIPAQGFYEWREEDGKKQPYYISRKDGELITFAGIWEFAEQEGEKFFSFAMLTGEPNEVTAPYHDRLPLITDNLDQWLDSDDPLEGFEPIPAELYEIRPMNPKMGSSKIKDLAIIENFSQNSSGLLI